VAPSTSSALSTNDASFAIAAASQQLVALSSAAHGDKTINELLEEERAKDPHIVADRSNFRRKYGNRGLRYVFTLAKIFAFGSPNFQWSGVYSELSRTDLVLFDICANHAVMRVIRVIGMSKDAAGLIAFPAHVGLWAALEIIKEPNIFRRNTRRWTRMALCLSHFASHAENKKYVGLALKGANYLVNPPAILGTIQLFFCLEHRGMVWQLEKMVRDEPGFLRNEPSDLPLIPWSVEFPLSIMPMSILVVSTPLRLLILDLMAVVQFRHNVLEWEPGFWCRAAFGPWDVSHHQSYLDYCNRESVTMKQMCRALAAWYVQPLRCCLHGHLSHIAPQVES
jgi:hypothetical protein